MHPSLPPIMMTTMAALRGTLPSRSVTVKAATHANLSVSPWADCLYRNLLTLYITPVIYLYLERLQMSLGNRNSVGTS
jgi:HAE1 family hydrophobic/amphiphilic exporter-1